MIRQAVSLAIRHPARPGKVLLVQRPDDDEDLPGVWGLPASSLAPDETWQEAVRRTGRDKLGVDLRPGRVLEEGSAQRAGYTLHMRLCEAALEAGEPHVPQPVPGITQYQAWKWGTPDEVRPAAERGSLCSRLLLKHTKHPPDEPAA